MDIKVTTRTPLTAVGNETDFREAVTTFTGSQRSAEESLTRMVAFAFSTYVKGGTDKAWPIDHIRENVALSSKRKANLLSRCLSNITRAEVPEGMTPAKAALAFANRFVADFYDLDTKEREAAQAKRREDAEAKAKKAKKDAEAELKKLREEVREEVRAEEAPALPEFCLLGEDGLQTPLTPDEYTTLAQVLSEMRTASEAGHGVNLVVEVDDDTAEAA